MSSDVHALMQDTNDIDLIRCRSKEDNMGAYTILAVPGFDMVARRGNFRHFS